MHCYQCEFKKNKANDSSAISVLDSSKTNNITLSYCNFESNEAIKNTISLIYSKVLIQATEFNRNVATTRSKNIFCGFSEVYII